MYCKGTGFSKNKVHSFHETHGQDCMGSQKLWWFILSAWCFSSNFEPSLAELWLVEVTLAAVPLTPPNSKAKKNIRDGLLGWDVTIYLRAYSWLWTLV